MVDKKLNEADLEENVDKSFNDDELEDIMNEIESLEQEFNEDGESTPSGESDHDSNKGEEVHAKAKKEDSQTEPSSSQEVPESEKDHPHEKHEAKENVVPFNRTQEKSASSPSGQSTTRAETPQGESTQMDFHVSGSMELNMSFCVGGKKVYLTVNEQEGLGIEMEGGVRFTLPIKETKKKAS